MRLKIFVANSRSPNKMGDDMEPFRLVHKDEKNPAAATTRRAALEKRIPPAGLRDLKAAASEFLLDDELETAINAAITVGAPLLLTGEPGTGKTQVAWYLGWYFDVPVFSYHVKSNSTASDLKYDFDAVAYLRWAQHGEDDGKTRSDFLVKKPLWQAYLSQTPAVLLIDEIDKAPRDFPNDLLHELDQTNFPHPFGEGPPIAPAASRGPIVVVTSNIERQLPDAFLRRCIYHHIDLTSELIKRIVAARRKSLFPNLAAGVEENAIARFDDLRKKKTWHGKKPSTAELLTWLTIMAIQGVQAGEIDRLHGRMPGIVALVKDKKDRESLG